jgi:hypothetical protein
MAEVRALSGAQLGLLYERCAGCRLEPAHFVPAGLPAGRGVRHFGVNSLPVFRRFEKRFMRAPADARGGVAPANGRLWGYNHQALAPLTGPGYFVVDARADGAELVIDYSAVPERDPGAGWPRVRDNRGIPARWVYGALRDRMRRVSAHVSIGRAFRGERPLSTYFALVREP